MKIGPVAQWIVKKHARFEQLLLRGREKRLDDLAEAVCNKHESEGVESPSMPLCVFFSTGLQPSEFENLELTDKLAVLERICNVTDSEESIYLRPSDRVIHGALADLCEGNENWFTLGQIATATNGRVEEQTIKNRSTVLQENKLLIKKTDGRGFRIGTEKGT